MMEWWQAFIMLWLYLWGAKCCQMFIIAFAVEHETRQVWETPAFAVMVSLMCLAWPIVMPWWLVLAPRKNRG